MRFGPILSVLVLLGIPWFTAPEARAQQVTVATPYHTLSDSFFENIGTSWGLNWQNGFFRFGSSPNQAAPQFGGFDPGAGFNTGWAFRRNGLDGYFNLAAGQGYRQSFTTQTPSVTLMNGQPGFISDTSQSPFVISYIPVVGGIPTLPYPYATMAYPGYTMAPVLQPMVPGNARVQAFRRQMANQNQAAAKDAALRRAAAAAAAKPATPAKAPRRPAAGDVDLVRSAPAPAAAPGDASAQKLASAQSSSAGRAVPSVAEARRLHQLEQAAQGNEAMVLFERGLTAEEGGKPNVAKIYYGMALERATGEQRERIRTRLDALGSPDGK